MSKARTVALWVLQVLLAAQFLLAALPKLTNNPGIVERFRQWGYPDHFYMLVGVVEVLGALGLLLPRVAMYGAVALMTIMVGASLTHLVHQEFPRVAYTGTLLVLLALVGYARSPAFLRRGRGQP
ncbi:MAG: DoxX family protein [Candidatus Acidiferrales bacterium]